MKFRIWSKLVLLAYALLLGQMNTFALPDSLPRLSQKTQTQEPTTEKIQLEDLWDATVTRAPDIQFVLKKLQIDELKSNDLPFNLHIDFTCKDVVYGDLITPGSMLYPLFKRKHKLSQEEEMIMTRMLRDKANALVKAYHEYKTIADEHKKDTSVDCTLVRQRLIEFAGADAVNKLDSEMTMTNQEFDGLTKEKLEKVFQGYETSFVLFDTKTQHYFHYNPKLCSIQLSPMSTFKIFNSLVGLETGVIKDENHSMVWDGVKRWNDNWNRDQTLQSAMTNSVVWYYQNLASSVGEERMKKFIQEAHYGNEDISGGITKFWLGNTLKISADEQVEFLKRLVSDDLPFSKRSMAIVRGLIRQDQTEKGALYGKTGSNQIDNKWTLGWFVGYVAQPGRICIFATNIQAPDGASGIKARELTKQVLTESGLF